MTPKAPLKNVVSSVRARLTQRASAAKENVQLALTRFATERLLYRLSLSPHRDQFVLKGAMLFSLWTPTPYRATGDLDLLEYGDSAPERIAAVFRKICRIDVEDDGVVFKSETLRAEPARAEDEYSDVRIPMTAEIAGARLPIQIDIGLGDTVTPSVQEIDYPSLFDMPAPRLRAYPPETVVAEKFQALVALGMLNSRMHEGFLRPLGDLGDVFLRRTDPRGRYRGDFRPSPHGHPGGYAHRPNAGLCRRCREAGAMAGVLAPDGPFHGARILRGDAGKSGRVCFATRPRYRRWQTVRGQIDRRRSLEVR